MRVGLLDSGVDTALEEHLEAAAAFTGAPLAPDRLGHGSALARIILHHAPAVALLNAQVFGAARRTTARQVAEGLSWLVGERVQLANLSLGLREDRDVLRQAVADALAAGAILLAAAPARGGPAYPAAYPGVIRITGDARCAPDELSRLSGTPADYGACPNALDGAPGGASLAVAHATGLLAGALAHGEHDPRRALDRLARFHGRERRRG